MLYGIHWRNSHLCLCRLATSLLHEPFKYGEFLIAYFTLFNFADEIAELLSRHRNCILQLLQLGLQTRTEFVRRWWERTSMKPIIFTIHNSINTIHPPPGCLFLECKEVSRFPETVSIDDLSYNRLHPSALSILLRFEEYGEYFFLCKPIFHHISEQCHFTHFRRRSLSPFLASLELLYSASSTPVLMSLSPGRSCARSSHSSCPSSGDASLLGDIPNSSPYLFHRI